MRRRAFLATLGASTVAAAGCLGSGSTGGASEYDVGMSVSRFRPEELAVAPGTTVVWKNTSKSSHTVTAYENAIPEEAAYFASGGFDSEDAARDAWNARSGGSISQRETYSHTFEIPGTYNYVCIPHEPNGMVGSVVVSEDATLTPEGGRVTVTTDRGGTPTDGTASTPDATSTE
jgi:plastocyanin